MKITVVAVGKLKERFWRDACDEYAKRLSRYVALDVRELDDHDPAKNGGEQHARQLEASDVRKALPKGVPGADGCLVCLDSTGRQLTSQQFAAFIQNCEMEGCKNLAFCIGGPTGIDQALKNEADHLLSFGKLTLPHNLARVVLLEQVYRAYRINRGEPYHK